MSEYGVVIIENSEDLANNLEEKFGSCSLDRETETPSNLKAKKIHVGDGNIIGKSVIQEFFHCTAVMPINKGSILLDTNCYAVAIVILVARLERKFVHIHPALQKIFYELPNILHRKA